MAADGGSISIRVNGVDRTIEAPGSRRLLSVLRDDLGLTGTKYGCEAGVCGSCTVLLDDSPVRACVLPVSAVGSRSVTTIEGLGGEGLDPIQEAFLEVQAFQCGYCTPGMIMSTAGLLRRNPNPTEAEIREALAGNLCRCAVYSRVIRAVQLAARTTDR